VRCFQPETEQQSRASGPYSLQLEPRKWALFTSAASGPCSLQQSRASYPENGPHFIRAELMDSPRLFFVFNRKSSQLDSDTNDRTPNEKTCNRAPQKEVVQKVAVRRNIEKPTAGTLSDICTQYKFHETPSAAGHLAAVPDPDHHCAACYVARSYSPGISEIMLWHLRLGHRNFRALAKLLGIRLPAKPIFCKACVEGKLKRYPLQRSDRNPSITPESPRPAYLFFTDAAGPFRVQTRSGARYLVLFVDDKTRRIFAFMLKSLSDFLPTFKHFVARLEAEFGREKVVAQILADNHRVHTSVGMDQFCTQKGIFQMFSPPYTPSLNTAERYIGIVIEMARVMIIHANAPKSLSGEAIMYAVFILNRVPCNFESGLPTPIERWNDRRMPDACKHAKVWGCEARPLSFPTEERDKFDPKTEPVHFFAGIDEQRRCYRLLSLPHFKLTFSAHASFLETSYPCEKLFPRGKIFSNGDDTNTPLIETPDNYDGDPLSNNRTRRQPLPSDAFLRNIPDEDTPPEEVLATTDRGNVISNFFEEIFSSITAPTEITPNGFQEYMAMPGPQAKRWRQADISEFTAHERNETYGPPTDLPSGFRAISTARVFKIKRDRSFKIRLVAHGYRMVSELYFNEVFAAVPRVIFLAIAVKFDLDIVQKDALTAFIGAPMDTEVYITLPEAFN
jgi:hypothetical protein